MLSSLICSVGGAGDRVDGGNCWDGGAEQFAGCVLWFVFCGLLIVLCVLWFVDCVLCSVV